MSYTLCTYQNVSHPRLCHPEAERDCSIYSNCAGAFKAQRLDTAFQIAADQFSVREDWKEWLDAQLRHDLGSRLMCPPNNCKPADGARNVRVRGFKVFDDHIRILTKKAQQVLQHLQQTKVRILELRRNPIDTDISGAKDKHLGARHVHCTSNIANRGLRPNFRDTGCDMLQSKLQNFTVTLKAAYATKKVLAHAKMLCDRERLFSWLHGAERHVVSYERLLLAGPALGGAHMPAIWCSTFRFLGVRQCNGIGSNQPTSHQIKLLTKSRQEVVTNFAALSLELRCNHTHLAPYAVRHKHRSEAELHAYPLGSTTSSCSIFRSVHSSKAALDHLTCAFLHGWEPE